MNSDRLRRYNDRLVLTAIEHLDASTDMELELNCECEAADCIASMPVPIRAHLARIGTTRLIVAPGHATMLATVVLTGPGYTVIEPRSGSGVPVLTSAIDAETSRLAQARAGQSESG